MSIVKIEINKNIFAENHRIADSVKTFLKSNGIFTINILGSPGGGKTSVIKRLIKSMPDIYSFVIEADVASDIDSQALQAEGIDSFQINTYGGCHIDAKMMQSLIQNNWFTEKILPAVKSKPSHPCRAIMYIENIGNLVCPAEFILGEDMNILICAVTDGSDKPYKYPVIFEKADVICVNKTDMVHLTDFNEEFFSEGIKKQNRKASILKICSKTGIGLNTLKDFIIDRICSQHSAL